MAKPVATTALNRLKQDYVRLQRDPVPFITAEPLPSNILTWYYVVRGPENTPYYGGIYLGKLVFPREFPFKPPSIYMLTPNGRFKVNQKLCLSISDFHPDTWNPAWSVSTILTGLLSFMLENTPTSGSTESSDATKRRLAQESLEYNLLDKVFCELFPDIENEIKEKLNQIKINSNANINNQAQMQSTSNSVLDQHQNRVFSFLGNIFVVIGLAAFALVVKYIVNTMY